MPPRASSSSLIGSLGNIASVSKQLRDGARTVSEEAARLSSEGAARLTGGVADAAEALLPVNASASALASNAIAAGGLLADGLTSVGSSLKEAVDENGQVEEMLRAKVCCVYPWLML